MVATKKEFFQTALLISFIFGAVACTKTEAPKAPISENQSFVQSYTNAYNAHDLERMKEMMHEDIEWINIEGSDQTIITEGETALTNELKSYFAGNPKSVSALSDWSVNGKYISAKETITYTREDGTQGSQASISVYELDGQLIRRVWYFPAE